MHRSEESNFICALNRNKKKRAYGVFYSILMFLVLKNCYAFSVSWSSSTTAPSPQLTLEPHFVSNPVPNIFCVVNSHLNLNVLPSNAWVCDDSVGHGTAVAPLGCCTHQLTEALLTAQDIYQLDPSSDSENFNRRKAYIFRQKMKIRENWHICTFLRIMIWIIRY